ncbi:putative 2-oxoglutarate-dependent dioxygenase AOP1 [Sesamum angolense]|uniref:2-oxoglutarate-dependent dioxygenase AOP1 n=1 Tax=Sesamum angolense TaxID=2727404 RepID=A0AAE1XFZ5_9LAMI|nr:putative 2-oxoglutarate-dependent dioxygenase AOP1 [Sesamum angolense]
MAEIPIIDLSTKTLNPSSSSWVSACKYVQHALEEYGFFLARYDDFPSELDKQVFDVMEELFDLPLETKTRNWGELAFHGYVGQLPHAPLHESMGIPDATTSGAVEAFTTLMWPSGNNRFCESISCYVKLVAELEQKVDKMVLESYGAEKHYESHVGSTTYLLRTLKYSTPDSNNNSSNNNIGANIHTDKNFLTIIHQNQVNGLEIQPRNGEWFAVDFPPAPGSFFVVMAGDSYQAWSNGRIYSARHQVLMKGDKPRYSLALFSYNNGITHIPEELVDTEHPLQFKPFDSYGLLRFYLSRAPSDMSGSSAKEYCGITV